MFEQLILISSALVGGADGTVELPLDDAMSKIDAQLLAYCSEEGIHFDLNSRVRPIYDDVGNVIGFRTNIGGQELSFDLAGYSIDLPQANEAPEYYSSSLAGMTMLSDLASFNGFSVNSCVCQIPSLATIYGSSTFGTWDVVSFGSGDDDCAQIASLDLIYSYRFTHSSNPSIYSSASALYAALQYSQNYQPGLGVTLSDYLSGLNSVLTSSYQAMDGAFNATNPVVCAYSPNSGQVGHFAMKIGEAETTAFWLIKDKWDIVVSTNRNFTGFEPTVIDASDESCFFGIKADRRQATFVLFGC